MRSVLMYLGISILLLFASVMSIYWTTVNPPLRPSLASDKKLPNNKVDNKLGTALPLDTALVDERGQSVTLGQAMNGKPTLLVFAYYHCQQMCNQVLTQLVDQMAKLTYTVGKEFNVVTVSIDPKESPQTAWSWREHYREDYKKLHGSEGTEEGWRFLTAKQPQIDLLTDAAGFRYEEIDKPLFQPVGSERKNKEFAHPAVINVLRPDGVLTRYLPGLDWKAKDLKFALIDSNGELGDFPEKVVLRCFMSYDTHRGEYTLQVWKLMQIACLWTFLMVVCFVGLAFWRGSRSGGSPAEAGGAGNDSAADRVAEG